MILLITLRLIFHRPMCVLYAQAMTYGGDLGLAVASSTGKARAVLVCTTPLQDFCPSCVTPQQTASPGKAPFIALCVHLYLHLFQYIDHTLQDLPQVSLTCKVNSTPSIDLVAINSRGYIKYLLWGCLAQQGLNLSPTTDEPVDVNYACHLQPAVDSTSTCLQSRCRRLLWALCQGRKPNTTLKSAGRLANFLVG